jgi:hypothetical protein
LDIILSLFIFAVFYWWVREGGLSYQGRQRRQKTESLYTEGFQEKVWFFASLASSTPFTLLSVVFLLCWCFGLLSFNQF